MVTPPHGGGGGVATPSSVGSEPAPPDEAAAVLAAIAAASLHTRLLGKTLEPACLCTSPSAYIRVHAHACYSVYMRTQSSLTHVHPTGEPADPRAAGRAAGTARRARQAGGTYTHILTYAYAYDICIRIKMYSLSLSLLKVTGKPYDLFARAYALFAHAHAHRRTRCSPRGSAVTRRGTSGPLLTY